MQTLPYAKITINVVLFSCIFSWVFCLGIFCCSFVGFFKNQILCLCNKLLVINCKPPKATMTAGTVEGVIFIGNCLEESFLSSPFQDGVHFLTCGFIANTHCWETSGMFHLFIAEACTANMLGFFFFFH